MHASRVVAGAVALLAAWGGCSASPRAPEPTHPAGMSPNARSTGAQWHGESAQSDQPAERERDGEREGEPEREPERERAGSPAEPVAAPPIPPNTAILHIGDSFVLSGFSQALKPRIKAVGARYEVRSEQSSYTVTWAARLERVIADTQPDLVIITLGANEVANTTPPAHAPAVRRIVQIVGKRPCVWVTPPLWRKDTGIIDVIRENSAPCRLFDSDTMVRAPIARKADKIHPTPEGGAVWADAFWTWLESERAPARADGSERRPWALKPSPVEEHQARSQPPPIAEPGGPAKDSSARLGAPAKQ